jgi:hypothetical protein
MWTLIATAWPTLNNLGVYFTWERVLVGILLSIVAIAITALIIMILWNLIIPSIFPSVRCVSFWQALGLAILIAILF